MQHPDEVRPRDFGDSQDDRLLAFSVSEARLYRVGDAKQARTTADSLPAGLLPFLRTE